MNSNGSLQEVDYEGVKFFLFDNFQNFSKEIERSKKAILKTNFDGIKKQVPELSLIHHQKIKKSCRLFEDEALGQLHKQQNNTNEVNVSGFIVPLP